MRALCRLFGHAFGAFRKPPPRPSEAQVLNGVPSQQNTTPPFLLENSDEPAHLDRPAVHAPPFAIEMAPKALEGFKLFLYISAPISAAFLYNSVRP